MKKRIKFRPHHLLCNLCFQGKGYSAEFIENFKTIHDALNAAPDDLIIEIVQSIDDICTSCPDNKNDCCCKAKKTAAMDQAVLNALYLNFGDMITLNQLHTSIKQHFTMEDFHAICGKCSWYPEKLCEPVIKALVQKHRDS